MAKKRQRLNKRRLNTHKALRLGKYLWIVLERVKHIIVIISRHLTALSFLLLFAPKF
jgi:hypothetical protein